MRQALDLMCRWDVGSEILMTSDDSNFKAFSSPEVVELYANSSGLHQPAETYAFDKFVPQGASILDIGVGGGRTTPYLGGERQSLRWHRLRPGHDRHMCRKLSRKTFYCADATRPSMFEAKSFNVVIFSFNGIGAITTREDRLRCFAEVFRVLTPGGVFIFSSHNSKLLFNLPSLDNAGLARKAWRLARAAVTSIPLAVRLLSSGAFRAGAGYFLDPVHGGILTYCSTPELIELDGGSAGFQFLEAVHNLHPRKVPRDVSGPPSSSSHEVGDIPIPTAFNSFTQSVEGFMHNERSM